MTQLIVLDTVFDAPIAEVCAMSLSVNLHLDSMTHHREKVVAGRTSGQFVEGDVVTWSARHFGLPLRLTIRIFEVDAPHRFADEQVRGPSAAYHHEHLFTEIDGSTHMQDRLTFAAPFGPLGRLAEKLFLRRYMQRLLEERNAALVSHLKPPPSIDRTRA